MKGSVFFLEDRSHCPGYWDKNKKVTLSVKSPKDENDYRYFIEGDIPWIVLDPDHIDMLKKEILETVNF